MILAITLCVVLVSALLGSISILKSKEAIEKEAENNLINLVSSQAKEMEMSLALAKKDGKIIAGAGADLVLDEFSKLLSKIKIYDSGYMVLMAGNFDVLYHPNPEMNDINLGTFNDGMMADAVSQIENSIENTGIMHYQLNGEKKVGAFYKLSNGWIAMACPYVEEMFAAQRKLMWLLLAVTAGGIILSVIIAIILGKSISKPIVQFAKDVEVVATGDLSIDIEVTSKDEIGLLQKSLLSMVDSMKMQAQSAQKMAAGEQTFIDVRSEKDVLALGLQGILENNEKLSAEIENLSKSAAAGELNIRADEDAFEGRWKGLVCGLNDLVEKVAKPLSDAGQYIKKMAAGDDLEIYDTSTYEGEFKVLMENLLEVRVSLYAMLDATGETAREAVKGNLSFRADLSKLKGGYAEIVGGFNDTLDAVIEPINEASKVLSDMAEGKLGARVTGDYQGDYAQIKNALNSMGENIQDYIKEISGVLEAMANKNLNVSITRDYLGDFVQLKDSINHIVHQFNVILGDINSVAEQVESGASQVAASSQTLAQGASEQAGSLEQISASITEVAEQTKENAQHANKAYEFAQGGSDGAKEGNQRMAGMLTAMNDIKASSKNIGGVIKVIDDIAFQTNILALNAAVEAARAGEHGKGFAVVAEEVRNLAARSAEAAKETTDLIDDSIHKVDEGYQLANETAETLNEIAQGTMGTVKITNEIADASKQQSNAIEEINRGIEQISQVTQTNSATTEESASASEEMAGQAEILKTMINEFTLRNNLSLIASDKQENPSLKLLPQEKVMDIQAGLPDDILEKL